MKTISFKEMQARVTPGPYCAAPIQDPQWAVMVEGERYHCLAITSQDNDENHAIFLTHTANNFGPALEALEGVLDCISETRGKAAHEAVAKARSVLSSAKIVKVSS